MYFGLPVVSTDIPRVRDHFSDFALLVPPSDEHALADAIHALLDDEDLAKVSPEEGRHSWFSVAPWDQVTRGI